MNARDAMLARIRTALRNHPGVPGRAVPSTRPVIDDWVGRFRARAEALSSTVIGPVARRDVPAAVAGYLRTHQLEPTAVCWPALQSLDWNGAGLNVAARPAAPSDLVGITGVYCAIAETGTLMLLSGADTPASTSLLPETHVALLPVKRIVAHMEDAWALLRAEGRALPRAVNLISGPSRTADIEQTVTLGAHGPYRVLIVLVDKA